MSKHIAMTATSRDRAGKGNARETRRQGKVPAVIYGDNKPPVTIAVDVFPITKALHSGHLFTHLTDLEVGGQKHLVLARDVQLHPVKDTPIHVDFLRVSEKTVITVEVPLHLVNEDKSPAVKALGTINLVHHTLEVSCRADQIPEFIEIDVGALDIGDVLHVSDLKMPANTKSKLGAEETVVSVSAQMAEEVEEAPVVDPMNVPAINQKVEDPAAAGAAPAKAAAPAKDEKKK